MELTREFFYDEVRDGFYIPGIMKRAWGAELTVFSEFDRVCRKYKLPYYATGGTLLAMLRDGKFIPWDDDIDIWMLRADYIRFCKIIKEELPWELSIDSIEVNKEFNHLNPCLRTPILSYSPELLRKYHEFPYWAFLDIFPLDEISDSPEEEEYRKQIVSELYTLWGTLAEEKGDYRKLEEYIKKIEKQLEIHFERSDSLIGEVRQVIERIYQAYNGKKGKYFSCMPWYFSFDNKFPHEALKNPKKFPFCNVEITAPGDWEGILKSLFGDYSKKVKAGGGHNYPFYKKTEDSMELYDKEKIYWKYHFSDKDLVRPAVQSYRDISLRTADMLIESEKNMEKEWKKGAFKDCLISIENCQKEAIIFGNIIEKKKGKGTRSVSFLEKYCEDLYLAYQSIEKLSDAEEQVPEKTRKDLERTLEKLKIDLHKMRSVLEKEWKRQIVFLPHRAKYFASLRPLIDALNESGDFECKIIPIPYYDRLGDGGLADMHYEGEDFPKEYEICDYRSFDFAGELPDAIVMNSPYDRCNPVWTVDPFFYSKEMKKFTGKLVYIPWFVTDEIDSESEEDGKAFVNMDYYVTVPGVFHADLTIVQSEGMKKAYLAKISQFTNKEVSKKMEKKISGAGSCLFGEKEGQGTRELVEEFKQFIGKR